MSRSEELMSAVVLSGVGQVEVREVPRPKAGAGQVEVRVVHAGVCGSDIGLIRAVGTFDEPHPLTGAHGDQVLGHEFSGIVSRVGAGVTQWVPGDRVVALPVYSCGSCDRCVRGLTNVCRTVAFHGINATGGGLAQWTVVPEGNLVAVPDNVDLAEAAVTEPLAVAYRAVRDLELDPSEFALVIGAGPIGIAVGLNLRALGLARIVFSEASATRRRIVADLGFEVVDPVSDPVVPTVLERTAGAGADAVFECAGAAAALADAFASVRARGSVAVLASYKTPVTLDALALMTNEIVVRSTLAYTRSEFEATVELLASGAFPTTGWVEHAPLDDFLDALSRMESGLAMKVLLDCWELPELSIRE